MTPSIPAAPLVTVLLVEDDHTSRRAIARFLERKNYAVIRARNGAEAVRHLTAGVAAVITDLVMPRMDGMALLRVARENAPHTPVIMMTGQGSEKVAVEALKAGAFHYLVKPVNPEELLHLLRQAVEKYRMAVEIAGLHRRLNENDAFGRIIGTSPVMRRLFETIQMVADTPSTVLIEGETGTGKELIARALHHASHRRDRPFVAINCAALPEALVESELFGHEKGAFTGAVARRTGKFLAADGGTLLIDEIAEMPLELQAKLLRALESHVVTPVGGNREIEVDVRIVASTHRDLEQCAAEGTFREDLFYRLNVVNLRLPPLRERREDIPLLVRAFIDEIAERNERSTREISPEALAQLEGFDWPGNVRQLKNMLESIIVLSSRDTIDVVDLPDKVRGVLPQPSPSSVIQPGMTLEEIQREAIRQALVRAGGNRAEAARLLGMSERTLYRRIEEYGLG